MAKYFKLFGDSSNLIKSPFSPWRGKGFLYFRKGGFDRDLQVMQ